MSQDDYENISVVREEDGTVMVIKLDDLELWKTANPNGTVLVERTVVSGYDSFVDDEDGTVHYGYGL